MLLNKSKDSRSLFTELSSRRVILKLLQAVTNIIAVTSLKHWIHLRLSSLCPPTSNILQEKKHVQIGKLVPYSKVAKLSIKENGEYRVWTEYARVESQIKTNFTQLTQRSRWRNGLSCLPQWPSYLQGPGFESHLRPVEFFARNIRFHHSPIDWTICAMFHNNLA